MRAIFADAALVLGGSFAPSLIVKVTVMLGLALVASRLARRSRAAVRHVLLAVAFAMLLALPATAVLMPSRAVEVATTTAGTSDMPAAVVPFFVNTTPAHTEAPVSAARAPVASFGASMSTLLIGAWALGAFALLVPFVAGLWQMRSLRRSGSPWPAGAALVRSLSVDARVRRRIDVCLLGSVPGPMTCGILRPAILLPPDVKTWSDDELRRALIHELEHVRRGDWASQCLARAICSAYWFHPLVWIAWHHLRLEAERACDDAVLLRAEPAAYADQLVVLAKRIATATTQPMLAMAACRDLPTRVRAVLDVTQTRGHAGARCVATAFIAAAVLVAAIAPVRAVAQGQPAADVTQAPVLAFETASVKPNKSGVVNEQYIRRDERGNLTVVNMPLRQLIVFAYQLQGFQLEGGPGWITSDRFDILAKPEHEITGTSLFGLEKGPDPFRLMLRTLLTDRFKLAVHKETKDLPIFELVLARQDGKPGSQLRPASVDCVALSAGRAARGGGPPPGTPTPPGPGSCGVTVNAGRIRFGGLPLSSFANTLSQPTQRVVVDRTGLSGNWEFELTFTPDQGQLPPGPPPPGAQLPNIDPNGPSLFTAIEEQLGLKLRPARGPVEVLVIDRVEQPTEN